MKAHHKSLLMLGIGLAVGILIGYSLKDASSKPSDRQLSELLNTQVVLQVQSPDGQLHGKIAPKDDLKQRSQTPVHIRAQSRIDESLPELPSMEVMPPGTDLIDQRYQPPDL